MEVKGLIDLLTFSGIRRDAFLFLRNGPSKLDEIKEHLKLSTPEIQPQLKKLESNHMIEKVGDAYILTELGEIAAHYLEMFFETTTAIDSNNNFWEKHDLSVIPKKCLFNIKKLRSCSVATTKNYKIGESHPDFIKNVHGANKIKGVTSVINPSWIGVFTTAASRNIQLEIVMTIDVYDEILMEYPEKLEQLLINKNSHIYICDDDIRIAFASMFGENGPFLSLGLHNKNTGCYDNQNDLEGHDLDAMEWGEELFEYYKEMSVEVEMTIEKNEFLIYEEKNKSIKIGYT